VIENKSPKSHVTSQHINMYITNDDQFVKIKIHLNENIDFSSTKFVEVGVLAHNVITTFSLNYNSIVVNKHC
jgi:hypothetical protein